MSKSLRPIKPACLCTTQASHIAVKSIGIDIICPTLTIHSPGFGNKFKLEGINDKNIVGKATPRPNDKNINEDT